MKFVVATLSVLVLVFIIGGSLAVVGGVMTPQVFKVITAAVN